MFLDEISLKLQNLPRVPSERSSGVNSHRAARHSLKALNLSGISHS